MAPDVREDPKADDRALLSAFEMLGNPTRRSILRMLALAPAGERSAAEVYGLIGLNLNKQSIDYHLGQLRLSGFIESRCNGRNAVYRFLPGGFEPAAAFLCLLVGDGRLPYAEAEVDAAIAVPPPSHLCQAARAAGREAGLALLRGGRPDPEPDDEEIDEAALFGAVEDLQAEIDRPAESYAGVRAWNGETYRGRPIAEGDGSPLLPPEVLALRGVGASRALTPAPSPGPAA